MSKKIVGRGNSITEKLGEGGFGVVFMAEQLEPVRRRVALKIVKLGMDTREVVNRFEAERQALKGNRFVLLRGFERLNEKGQIRLAEMMALNQPLYELYLLKECLRRFWRMPTEGQAKDFLDAWIILAKATTSWHFNRLAETLQEHRHGLLAYFRHPISTGPLEGINNKIKVLKRQAYGFRDMEYFKLRLYHLHCQGYSLTG